MESGIVSSKHPLECHWHNDWHACNCGLFNTIVYSEPDKDDKIVIHRVTVEDAIDKQIIYAKNMGCYYKTQDDALHEFMSLHWATYETI